MIFRKINFRVLAVLLLISVLFAYELGYTHPGRTDANGGHVDRKTGKYHKHGGGSPRSPVNDSPSTPERSVGTPSIDTDLTASSNNTVQVSKRSQLRAGCMEY